MSGLFKRAGSLVLLTGLVFAAGKIEDAIDAGNQPAEAPQAQESSSSSYVVSSEADLISGLASIHERTGQSVFVVEGNVTTAGTGHGLYYTIVHGSDIGVEFFPVPEREVAQVSDLSDVNGIVPFVITPVDSPDIAENVYAQSPILSSSPVQTFVLNNG